MGDEVTIVSRDGWGSAPVSGKAAAVIHPVNYVVLTHTSTRQCEGDEDCGRLLRSLQDYYLQLKRLDLPYNFMVGGQGRVYEGRGWHLNGITYKWHSVSETPRYLFKTSLKSFIQTMERIRDEKMDKLMAKIEQREQRRVETIQRGVKLKPIKNKDKLREANRLYGRALSIAMVDDYYCGYPSDDSLTEFLQMVEHGKKNNYISSNCNFIVDFKHALQYYDPYRGMICTDPEYEGLIDKRAENWGERFY